MSVVNVHEFLAEQHLPLVERTEIDGQRWYRIPGETDPANYFASVTNILSVAHAPELVQYFKKTSYKKQTATLEQTATLGSYIHNIVENDLQGVVISEKDLVPEMVIDTDAKGNPIFGKPWNLTDWFKRWQKLKTEKQITAQAVELPVVNTKYGYAGTLDFLGSYMGEPAIFDIKSGFYGVKAGYQLSAYKHAWEAMTGYKTHEAYVTGPYNPNLGELPFEVRQINSPIRLVGLSLPWNKTANAFLYEHEDFCWNRFLDALGLFRGLNYRKLDKQKWKFLHVERD